MKRELSVVRDKMGDKHFPYTCTFMLGRKQKAGKKRAADIKQLGLILSVSNCTNLLEETTIFSVYQLRLYLFESRSYFDSTVDLSGPVFMCSTSGYVTQVMIKTCI